MKYENLFQEIKRKDVTTTAWSLGAPCKKKKNQTNKEKNPQQVRTCSKEILEACDTWAIKCKQQKKDIPQVTFFPWAGHFSTPNQHAPRGAPSSSKYVHILCIYSSPIIMFWQQFHQLSVYWQTLAISKINVYEFLWTQSVTEPL